MGVTLSATTDPTTQHEGDDMGFQTTKRGAADVILAQLTDEVNRMLQQSDASEHDVIRMAADTVAHFIGDEVSSADHVVDINLGGSNTENSRALSVSCTITRVRPRAGARDGAKFAPWNPPERRAVATDQPAPADVPTSASTPPK